MFALFAGIAIVVLDQWLKFLVLKNFSLGETVPVISGFFNLTYLRNTGAVWGTFQHQNDWLVLLSFVMLFMIAVFYRRLVNGSRLQSFSVACMLGGIVGNLVDRMKFGWVVDFLDFHYSALQWPAFNLADAAICFGVGIYAVSTLLAGMPKPRSGDSAETRQSIQ